MCRRQLAAGVVLAFVARSVLAAKVQVRIYVEAGCPYCREYLNGPVQHALEDAGVSSLIEMDVSPFGNAYFLTEQCLYVDGALNFRNRAVAASSLEYDVGTRNCFDAQCGLDAETPLDECFSGQLVCQHGPRECSFNRYMACAKHLAPSVSTGASHYIPFVTCMENHYTASTDDVPSDDVLSFCAERSGMSVADLDECYRGSDGDTAVAQEAAAIPVHSGVPWVTIDGRHHATSWDDGYEVDDLVRAVREARDAPRQLRIVSASGVLATETGALSGPGAHRRGKERMC